MNRKKGKKTHVRVYRSQIDPSIKKSGTENIFWDSRPLRPIRI